MTVLRITILSALLAIALCLGEPISQQTCPPCRQNLEPFGKTLHVTHEGQRVYVCCAGCAVKMQRDWDGYLRVMTSLGERPDRVEGDESGGASDKPSIFNPDGRGVCEACMGGACELPEHKPDPKIP